jgi:hypothetical protein
MKLKSITASDCWDSIRDYTHENNSFKSITGIKYKCWFENNTLYYVGENRNGGNPETIPQANFFEAFDKLKNTDKISPGLIKNIVPKTLYRKRSPLVGILLAVKALE